MHRLGVVALYLYIALLLTGGGLLLVVPTLLSYEAVYARLSPYLAKPEETLTPAWYAAVRFRSQVAGSGFLLMGAALVVARAAVRRFFAACRLHLAWPRWEENRYEILALLALTLLGFVLRAAYLMQPIRFDEAGTYLSFASRSLVRGLSDYTFPNNHLFHTFLVHVTTRLAGPSLWAVRLPAFLAGVLIVPLTYVAARAHFNRSAALQAAALAASSSILIEYSTNARGYTLLCVFTLLLWRGVVGLLSDDRPAWWIVLGVATVLGCYTIPVMLFPCGGLLLWLLLQRWRHERQFPFTLTRKLLILGLVSAGLIFQLYMPALLASGPEALLANKYVTKHSFDFVIERLPDALYSTWVLWNRDVPAGWQIALVIGFVTALVRCRDAGRPAWLFVLTLLGWSLAFVLAQRVVPYERVWLPFLPLYLAVASAGVVDILDTVAGRQAPPWSLPFVAICVGGLFAFHVARSDSILMSDETGCFRDAEATASYLWEHAQPDDAIVSTGRTGPPLHYYYVANRKSPAPLFRAPRQVSRVWLIVDADFPETADMPANLKRAGLSGETPILVAHVGTARIYKISSTRAGSMSAGKPETMEKP